MWRFIADSHAENVDPRGLFQQTIAGIHGAIYRGLGDFWLALDESGEVAAYALGSVSTEIDNRLTYWLTQAYVARAYRGTPFVKEAWALMRAKAKEYLCKHIVVVSSRGTDAYCRFLGEGWHPYAALLKEDL